ncbi:c2 domain-containing protein 3 [Stylonychia lemnae]|uniref:C2 domain-containing protein 3 n=1 Tax=Stylonychia lemnae TaxID=5949 RepID=A0A078ADJ4_STYLE|nr:c2 domain-containing protein 3 [Stylonychia lemnae]|eukprot:CDW78943.1 c2 domain-containing protein 3 [Stylonychia lemnae]
MLPPEVEGPTFGFLFIEMQNLDWLTYDGQNYLEDIGTSLGPRVNNLFANIKFWGDQSKGVYLKTPNGQKKNETMTNKFKYDIKCPEKTFEKYLDDMGVLVIDFFDTEKNQTIGTSKIMLKLYIKSAFPIVLTGNHNVKIGQFNISIVSSYADQNSNNQMKRNANRQNIDLDDSFEENEKLAHKMTQQDRNKKIIENAFRDDRIPSSYQDQKNPSSYKKQDFDFEIDERPTRERPNRNTEKVRGGKENQRNLINIDENEDTFTNQAEFDRIFARGEKLRQQMNQALDSDNAWETLHGTHQVPKRYIPPFLQEEQKKAQMNDDELDNIYAIEIEGYNLRESQELKGRKGQSNDDVEQIQQEMSQGLQRQETQHIRDMKFIKIKIGSLRIEDEGLLHSLIDETFNITVNVPLPDIYQKKISNQLIKLSNYDIVSFNEFMFNNLSLYNFKIDEETFNQLVQAKVCISIEGKNVQGSISMIKLLMSKAYKLEASIPLEQTIFMEDPKPATNQKGKADNKKGPKGQPAKPEPKKKATEESKIPQTFQKQVGHIAIEISLQRGDTEQELARDYQIKYQKLQEQKAKEEADRKAEMEKYMKFSQQQEPIFAQLYMNIKNIRNLCLNSDGSLNKALHEESFNHRLGLASDREEIRVNDTIGDIQLQQVQRAQIIGPKRNLFVQYKAFPALDKLKTNTVWGDSNPVFQYRSQFPVIMNPDTVTRLQNFTFILEVWDAKSPAQEEFIGLVKIPLASFCYSMKTTDDQIFSLNFLADQHCLYPMMISDGFLPIYSPRLGLNIGELQITLALGTAVQINRQIQKEQESDKQLIEMTFKTQMIDMIKQKQEEENRLRMTLEFQNQREREREEERRKEESEKVPEPERSVTPDRSMLDRLPIQDQILSGFNSILNKQLSPTNAQNNQNENQFFRNIGNYLRTSMNMSVTSRDVDMRKMTQLNCLRKLFEESRALEIREINSDEVFKENLKNFDGSLKKDDFLYCLLNKEEFTLTRSEISNIQAIMLNITKADQTNIDIDEIQFSYKQYIGYYDSLQEPINELFQLFKRNIDKKIDSYEQQEEFIRSIEERAVESKIPIAELKDILDGNGILLRDICYDQLASYFDLDRNDLIYINGFCEYLRRQSLSKLNFLKVSPNILTSRINNFIKEQILLNPDYMNILELEFKVEAHKAQGKSGIIEEIPDDILLTERINAKLFQFKLKRQGTVVSLWEIFTFFEHLNIQYAKLYHEPSRYHNILFPYLYKYILNEDYEARIKQERDKKAQELLQQQLQQQLHDQMVKASTESVFALAQDLNQQQKRRGDKLGSDGGIYSSKSEMLSESEEESEVIINKNKKKKKGKKRKDKEMTFVQKKTETAEEDEDKESNDSVKKQHLEDNRPYKKVKHVFEIKVKELKNIPILDKLIKDISRNELAQQTQPLERSRSKTKTSSKNQYIQNAAIKYTFPLDDDQVFQSDYIQLNNESLALNNQFDYKVSINTVHNYIINKEDSIQKHLKNLTSSSDQLFNVTLALYEGNKEYVVGNAQLPIEDLIDQIDMYQMSQFTPDSRQTLSRILFIYGTTFSQRENCIIGKMQLEINYKTERQYVAVDPNQPPVTDELQTQIDEEDNNANSCFLHKETYVKRKIPLNGVISVHVESLNNLKESIENIEHFAKIQQSSLADEKPKSSKLTAITGTSKKSLVNQSKDQLDRRRILTQIYRQGLNLVVIGSVFGDDTELTRKFPTSRHTSKLLYNTLNPIFNEYFDLNVQMDTKIFDYLNNKKAKFEIRHYIIQGKSDQLNSYGLNNLNTRKDNLDSHRSQNTQNTEDMEDKNILETNDYIIIGYVYVPLRNLLASNYGIDDNFVIFDEYKQQMGTLKLRISLNHHSQHRPLYSQETSTKYNNLIAKNQDNLRTTMIDRSAKISQTLARSNGNVLTSDHQMILGLNFVELLFKNRDELMQQTYLSQTLNQQSHMYLKFKVFGQNYQTKFMSSQSTKESQHLKQLKIKVFDIKKTVLIELDYLNQKNIEELFSRPLEIELWYKREGANKYQQPADEVQLGSFFIELNELSKIRNKRIKDQNGEGIFHSHEGYFSLYDFQREQVTPDRLGCKLYLIKKEYETQMADSEVLFHNLQQIETQISTTLDPQHKGFVDYEDLIALIQKELQDPYQSLIKALIDNMEYKNTDKIYYSPLFGPLPPFFRLVRKFDSFGIVEKFNKEFQQIDNHQNGFIPLTLFRTLLEHELKIKEKIVIDFIQNIRDVDPKQQLQSLDVNVFSHSFKNHIDYVVLLRKISFYFDNKINDRTTNNDSQMIESHRMGSEDVTLKINIESAMRLKNPLSDLDAPNSQVLLRLPFRGATPEQIQTQVVQRSSYPAWHLVGQQTRFQLNEDNIRLIIDRPLEFEVYHQQLSTKDQISKTLIGVAYVDLSQMIFVDGTYQINGYFHILRKDRFQDGHQVPLTDPQILSIESLGQIKLSVSTTSNLKQIAYQVPSQKTIIKQNSPVKERLNQSQMNMSLVRQSQDNVFGTQNYQPQILSQTQQKLMYSFNQISQDLTQQQDDDLKLKHTQNMSELDKLITSLKRGKLEQEEEQPRFHRQVRDNLLHRVETQNAPNSNSVNSNQMYNYLNEEDDLRVTRGYNQSYQMTQEFSKVTQTMKDQQAIAHKLNQIRNVVQEMENEGSEFDRDEEIKNEKENVFNRNLQESSRQYDRDDDFRVQQNQVFDYKPERQQEQTPQYFHEEDPMKQSFSPFNFRQQTLSQVPPLQITNVFERQDNIGNQMMFQGSQSFDDKREDDEVQDRFNIDHRSAPVSFERQQPATEQKKKSIFDIDEDEDDMYDAKEMERIAKILNSQKK